MSPMELKERTPVQESLESFQQAQQSYRETQDYLRNFLANSKDFFQQTGSLEDKIEVLRIINNFGLYNEALKRLVDDLEPSINNLELISIVLKKSENQNKAYLANHFLSTYPDVIHDFFKQEIDPFDESLFALSNIMQELAKVGYVPEVLDLIKSISPLTSIVLEAFEQTLAICAVSDFDQVRSLIASGGQTEQEKQSSANMEKKVIEELLSHFISKNSLSLSERKTLDSLIAVIDNHIFSISQFLQLDNSIDFLVCFHFEYLEKICAVRNRLFRKNNYLLERLLFAIYQKSGSQVARQFLVKHNLMNDSVESVFIKLDIADHHFETVEARLNDLKLTVYESLKLVEYIYALGHVDLAWRFFIKFFKSQPIDSIAGIGWWDTFEIIKKFFSHNPEKTWKFFMADQSKIRSVPRIFYEFINLGIHNGLELQVWFYLENSGKEPHSLTSEDIGTLLEKIWLRRLDLRPKISSWIEKLPNSHHKSQLSLAISSSSDQDHYDSSAFKNLCIYAKTEQRSLLIPNELNSVKDLYQIIDKQSNIRQKVLPTLSQAMRSASRARDHLVRGFENLDLPELCLLQVLQDSLDVRGFQNLISNPEYQRITLDKTGSEAKVWTNGVIENKIDKSAYSIWKEVHDVHGIPVAPIFGARESKDGAIRVLSRYCGISVNQMSYFSHVTPEWYWPEIIRQMNEIVKELEAVGISHNHPHQNNFTIEYIRKSVYRSDHNPNTMYYSSQDIHFDPERFMENPEEWVILVRLIDWDAASYKTPIHSPS